MKTYAFLALSCLSAAAATGCGSESLCERVECGSGGSAGSTESTTGTAQGPGSTGTSSGSSQPSSSTTQSGGGGDGGSSVSSSTSSSDGGGGSGDGGSGGTGGGDGGGGSGPGCDLLDGMPIGDTCGLFVDAGTEDGVQDGSKDTPFKTIQQAVDAADLGETIYVCNSAGHDEAVTIAADVTLVGGVGCASWIWTEDGRTAWRSEANTIPLTITSAAEVSLSNFDIRASDATNTGESSVGIFVVSSTLDIDLSNISAGNGANGQDETEVSADLQAMSGNPGTTGCTGAASTPAVSGGQNNCGGSRNGGLSGAGTNDPTFGGNAGPGTPLATGGDAGLGEGVATCATGGSGGTGDPGSAGTPGAGAPIDADGALSPSGFTSVGGTAGTPGTPGSGGGGGGGANLCTGAGPSGGGGGAGGCGGDIGDAGGGAGASVAIMSFSSNLSLANTVLATSDGGFGGDGAAGQRGQPGGDGGNSGNPSGACPGGPGGTGGQGGSAGGGRGGHSVGILWAGGDAPVLGSAVEFDKGKPGAGGAGGVGIDAPNLATPGAVGSNENILEVEDVED